jgi:ABC-2 type transport system ATP-binding protein
MRTLVAALAAAGQTVLLSSHLLGEVQEICHRVAVISAGRLVTEAPVNELRGAAGGLLVRADPLDVVLAVGMRLAGDDAVTVLDDQVRLRLDPDRTPDLIRELVLAGVGVREVSPVQRSLEEAFLEMTEVSR